MPYGSIVSVSTLTVPATPHTQHTDALIVFGGRDSMTQTKLRDAWIYDLTTLGSRWIKVRKPSISSIFRRAGTCAFPHPMNNRPVELMRFQVNNNGNQRNAPLPVSKHVGAAATRPVEGGEREGVLVVGGLHWDEAHWGQDAPGCYWWRHGGSREPKRCVWWLDVAERRWEALELDYACVSVACMDGVGVTKQQREVK